MRLFYSILKKADTEFAVYHQPFPEYKGIQPPYHIFGR